MPADAQRLAAMRAADGTLTALDDGRHVLRFERRLAHSVDRVWRAISEPAELAHWFPANVEWDFKPGASVQFHFPDAGPGGDGKITELDPPTVLEFTWSGEVLRFELQPDSDGCLLAFVYTFDDGKGAAKFAAGWHACLGNLETALGGGEIDTSMYRWDEVHDGYVEKFGLRTERAQAPFPDGTLETTGDTHLLRYERYFDRPAERVWRSLTRPEELVRWLAEADVDLVEGGHFNLRWLNSTSVMQGTITSLNWPYTTGTWPYVLEVDSDIHGLLRWEIHEESAGCVLAFVVTLPVPNSSLSELLAGWHVHLDHLADTLRGQVVNWPDWERDYMGAWAELRDRYAATNPV